MKKNLFLAAICISLITAPLTVHASSAAVADFSVRLLQQNIEEDQNTLISPFSVLYALSMTANGAKEDTLSQMEEILGMTVDEWNSYLSDYKNSLANEDSSPLTIANSIWFKKDDTLTIELDFLQTNSDYYQAEIFEKELDDASLSEINDWVCKETNGMIEEILKEIPEDAVMYLINALAFDGKWDVPYDENQIHENLFTSENGTEQTAPFMYCTENAYFEDENAIGFLKYYDDEKYAFAALLPNEDCSLKDYIASLNGDKINNFLHSVQSMEVQTGIPQFSVSDDIEMSAALKALGMTDAFLPDKADFSGLGKSSNGNIYIGQVLHKTFLSLDAEGTEAAAATAVEMIEECALVIEEEPKIVYLDRPFLYMIIDCEAEIPLFIGTVTSLESN